MVEHKYIPSFQIIFALLVRECFVSFLFESRIVTTIDTAFVFRMFTS